MLPGTTTSSFRYYLPIIGFFVFAILYVAAASLYPGGSDYDRSASGFSWIHNYWCELLAPVAQNGQPNTARITAITAMFILCASIAWFWYVAAELFIVYSIGRILVRLTGILSMLALPFLFSGYHDVVINIAGGLGLVAMILTIVALYRSRFFILSRLGILCVILCGVNNYVYYTERLLYTLPVIQKISFVCFLLWFSLVALKARAVNKLKS